VRPKAGASRMSLTGSQNSRDERQGSPRSASSENGHETIPEPDDDVSLDYAGPPLESFRVLLPLDETPIGSPNQPSFAVAAQPDAAEPEVAQPSVAGTVLLEIPTTAQPVVSRSSIQKASHKSAARVSFQPDAVSLTKSSTFTRMPDSTHAQAHTQAHGNGGHDDQPSNIKVCMRLRPMNATEVAASEAQCVQVDPAEEDKIPDTVQLTVAGNAEKQPFSFDWVLADEATQEEVFDVVGNRVVNGVADGFHGCVFAYGQTGSGKSHTIFGRAGEMGAEGLLPRIAEGLLDALEEDSGAYTVKMSYLEIYNEKLRDLLKPPSKTEEHKSLEIRQHPTVGVFVEGLTTNVLSDVTDLEQLLEFGHQTRVVGSTNMNAQSSRSHAVVSITVERSITQDGKNLKRRAHFHCVDLAGSERMNQVGGSKARQEESKQINKSLSTLALTISKLATGPESSRNHIPYRNSKLTYLLSESLMGNCRTVMLACASPAASSCSMTESTLRFAQSVKKIKTKPRQNEEIEGTLLNNLRAEIEHLRQQLVVVNTEHRGSIHMKLDASLAVEQMFKESLGDLDDQKATLNELGLAANDLSSAWKRGSTLKVRFDADPYLVNICDDPLLSGCLTYLLPENDPVSVGSDPSCTIQVEGLGIRSDMCEILNKDGVTVELVVSFGDELDLQSLRSLPELLSTPSVSIGGILKRDSGPTVKRSHKNKSMVYVNNTIVMERQELQDGDSLRIGPTHVFQVQIPKAAAAAAAAKTEDGGPRGVASIIKSITREGTFERTNAKQYAAHMKERVGGARTEVMLEQLQELLPLIEEANVMTEELREDADHEYIFKPQVLTNVLTAESGEIAVALCQMKKADDLDARGNPVYRDDGTPQADTSVIWTKRRFLARLEIMRDLHSEVMERDQPWGLNGDPNPWDDIDAVPMFGVPTAYGPHVYTPSDDTRFLDHVNDIVPRKHKLKTSVSSGSLGESPKHEESTNRVSIEVPSQDVDSSQVDKDITPKEDLEIVVKDFALPSALTSVTATSTDEIAKAQVEVAARPAPDAAEVVLPVYLKQEKVHRQTSEGAMSAQRSWLRKTSSPPQPTGGPLHTGGGSGSWTPRSSKGLSHAVPVLQAELPLLGVSRSASSLFSPPRCPLGLESPLLPRSVSPYYVNQRYASSSPRTGSPQTSPSQSPSHPTLFGGSSRSMPLSGSRSCGDLRIRETTVLPAWPWMSVPAKHHTQTLRSPFSVTSPKGAIENLPTRWRPLRKELPRRGRAAHGGLTVSS